MACSVTATKQGTVSTPQLQDCQLQYSVKWFPRNRNTFLCKKYLAFDAIWTEGHVCISSWLCLYILLEVCAVQCWFKSERRSWNYQRCRVTVGSQSELYWEFVLASSVEFISMPSCFCFVLQMQTSEQEWIPQVCYLCFSQKYSAMVSLCDFLDSSSQNHVWFLLVVYYYVFSLGYTGWVQSSPPY